MSSDHLTHLLQTPPTLPTFTTKSEELSSPSLDHSLTRRPQPQSQHFKPRLSYRWLACVLPPEEPHLQTSLEDATDYFEVSGIFLHSELAVLLLEEGDQAALLEA